MTDCLYLAGPVGIGLLCHCTLHKEKGISGVRDTDTWHLAAGATGKQSLESKLGQLKSTDDSVMSTKSNASSNTKRRRRSTSRRNSIPVVPAGDGDVVWVNGRPLTMPTSAAQNFTSPPQQATNLNNPTQGFTGLTEDTMNFSLPKHIQEVLNSDKDSTSSHLNEVASGASRQSRLKHTQSDPMGSAAEADKLEADSVGSQSRSNAQSASSLPAGLGAKLKAQLAALKAESAQEDQEEKAMTSTSQDQPAGKQSAPAQRQQPISGNLVSPPDSEQGGDAADTASDPGAGLASEQTWTAGMGQDLGKQLQARLARVSKAPITAARPPVHRAKPTSEQTWSAGQGASLASQLKQQLGRLRSASGDLPPTAEGAVVSQDPSSAGPRDADKFPAKPTRVPWTATVPESSEETWSDNVGRRVRQQLTTIRGLGNDVSVPPPRREQRASLFDLFSEQPRSDRPTWSAGIGERMRRQLEEMKKQREIEDSARTTSSSSHPTIPKDFTTKSLPTDLPASEQTWTAGMGHAAQKELLLRRSLMRRSLTSPEVNDDDGPERKPSTSVSQSTKDESSRSGKEYLQHDSLSFHHLEEIPHVSTFPHD